MGEAAVAVEHWVWCVVTAKAGEGVAYKVE
jgi:hypothetical protein